MSEQLRFVPPRVEFDPTMANELARYPAPAPTVADELYPLPRRRSPFKDYVRMLTSEGGILILYKDQDRGWFLMVLRVFAWIMATGVGGWLIFYKSSLSILPALGVFTLLMLVIPTSSPGAVGPASRLRRRYADAPTVALLTGLATREWSPLALRPYASFLLKNYGAPPLAPIQLRSRRRGVDPVGSGRRYRGTRSA